MATTKTARVLENGLTLTAGAGDDTGTALNLTDSYGGTLHLKLSNGGTGPTIGAQIQVETSADNSEWYSYGGALVGGLTASTAYSWNVDIPMGVMYIRTVQGSNTGQDVTCNIDFGEVEGL